MVAIDTVRYTTPGEPILTVRGVSRGFARGVGEVRVLAEVNLSLRSGEIVGLLGRSGSGKSTLLRIIAGLIKPSGGEVIYRGRPVTGPAEGIAMVFQTFALFPWLTVLQNVEAGLEALGVPGTESRRRALSGIDLIGLDGFESAYPREPLRRHAPARRLCPRAGRRADHPAAGRAFFGTRRIDCGDDPHRPSRPLDRAPTADQIDAAGHPQHRGSGLHVRPHSDLFLEPRARCGEIGVVFPHPRNRLDDAFRQMVDDI